MTGSVTTQPTARVRRERRVALMSISQLRQGCLAQFGRDRAHRPRGAVRADRRRTSGRHGRARVADLPRHGSVPTWGRLSWTPEESWGRRDRGAVRGYNVQLRLELHTDPEGPS